MCFLLVRYFYTFAVCGGVGWVVVWIFFRFSGVCIFVFSVVSYLLLETCVRFAICDLDLDRTWSVLSYCAYYFLLPSATALHFTHRIYLEAKLKIKRRELHRKPKRCSGRLARVGIIQFPIPQSLHTSSIHLFNTLFKAVKYNGMTKDRKYFPVWRW